MTSMERVLSRCSLCGVLFAKVSCKKCKSGLLRESVSPR
jgi:hypothetical protein